MNRQAMKYGNVMQINVVGGEAEVKRIARGQVAVLEHSKGAKLSCNTGLLWVTIENDIVDHILSERESMAIGTNSKVVLSGIQSATYRIV
ncbi:MAG: DUF2917 domain-containing protein [Rectinemataceae bacterium]